MNVVKSKKEIRNEIQIVFNEIKEETGWEFIKLPNELYIDIGDASEYYESFGVNRTKEKSIFGSWIEDVKHEYNKDVIWEMVIIREAFSLFIEEKILYCELSELTNFFLNIVAISYIQKKYPDIELNVKITTVRSRFRAQREGLNEREKALHLKIGALLDEVINQRISYKLILNTYFHYLEDYDKKDFDVIELLEDFSRYLSSSSEEIAAPIFLKEKTKRVFKELYKGGYKTTALKIAERLNVNQSTISRQLSKIDSRFYAKWRAMKNWKNLGLYTHLIIVKLPIDDKNKITGITKVLMENRYIFQIYEGKNNENIFIYTILHCPLIVAQNIENKLSRLLKKGIITSFVIKPIVNTTYKTAVVTKRFKHSIENFKKLLNNEIPCDRICLWNTDIFQKTDITILDKNDKDLLHFLSILISNSIKQSGVYGCWVPKTKQLLEKNNIDINNAQESASFLNKFRNQAMERNLLDYMIMVSLNTATSNYLIIHIKHNPKDNIIKKLSDDLSCFTSIVFLSSYQDLIISLIGPQYSDSLTKIIIDRIKKDNIDFEYFSCQVKNWRYLPLNELYDFESKKWLIK